MCKRINIFMPVLFLAYIVGSIAIGRIFAMAGVGIPTWLAMCMSELLILIPGLVYVLVMKINIVKCIPYRKIKPIDALLSLLFGYAFVPFMLFVSNLTVLFSTNYLDKSRSTLISYPFVVQIILMAVVPALVEEFIFRGLFYHSYRKNGILGAALLSGLVFGCFHLNINQFSYAFVMGIVFALLVEATGSMWSSVIAHFAINTYSIIVLKLVSLATNAAGIAGDVTENIEQTTLADYPANIIVIQLIVLAIVAAGFLGIAFLIFKLLAKRNGRWEYITANLKKGFKPQNNEKFLTIPAIATIIITFCFMIFLEI